MEGNGEKGVEGACWRMMTESVLPFHPLTKNMQALRWKKAQLFKGIEIRQSVCKPQNQREIDASSVKRIQNSLTAQLLQDTCSSVCSIFILRAKGNPTGCKIGSSMIRFMVFKISTILFIFKTSGTATVLNPLGL